MIKELEDILGLVEQLPRDWQMKCVSALACYVDGWEARQQEPHLSDYEYAHLQFQRRMERLEIDQKRREERWKKILRDD